MARQVGPSCKLCRREGEKLFLKGARCYTHKCSISRREYAPGQHGASAKKSKMSNFGLQLREKQKVKRIYGVLEKQFQNYFGKAAATKGVTGTLLLQYLERRLDNVVFQLGFATSRTEARQLVSHGSVFVNNRCVNIPSFSVKVNDEIEIKVSDKSRKGIQDNIETSKERATPAWLQADRDHFRGKVLRFPERTDILFPVNEQLIVELYSR
ncbi:MAG: 30S ribosomal protein S4 [Candidatus Omnitrophota bacterium]